MILASLGRCQKSLFAPSLSLFCLIRSRFYSRSSLHSLADTFVLLILNNKQRSRKDTRRYHRIAERDEENRV